MTVVYSLLFTLAVAVPCCVAQACSPEPLPVEVAQAKQDLIEICSNNLDKWGDDAFQQENIDGLVEILKEWFNDNRPANEVELTKGSWLGLWYEDDSIIFSLPGFSLDRKNTYQVVFDDFYYNVGKLDVGFSFLTKSFSTFLKGEFTIKDPPVNCGEERRNVIDLVFSDNRLKSKWIDNDEPLTEITQAVDSRDVKSVGIPGPRGVAGDLWNLYIDDELRVAFGGNDNPESEQPGLFVLIRQEFVSDD